VNANLAGRWRLAQSRLRTLRSRSPLRYVRQSVRGKLIAIVFLTTLLVLVVSGTSILVRDLSVYRNSWVADVASEASVLAVSTAPALAFNDREAAARHLAALGTRPSIMAAALYSADGNLFAQFVRHRQLPPPPRPPGGVDSAQVVGERVELTKPIRFNNETLGTLYVRARYGHEPLPGLPRHVLADQRTEPRRGVRAVGGAAALDHGAARGHRPRLAPDRARR
jgi:hypothetical protein